MALALRSLWWKAALVALGAFVVATVFSAYLRPDMLIQFANIVLCN
jgi:hypothetical protein